MIILHIRDVVELHQSTIEIETDLLIYTTGAIFYMQIDQLRSAGYFV